MRNFLQQLALSSYSVLGRRGFLSTSVGQDMFVRGYYLYKRHVEAPWVGIVERLAKPGTLAVDVGANIGFFTLALADAVGPSGHVLAFEPEAVNLQILKRVIRRRGCQSITVIGSALGEHDGMALLHLNPHSPADHRIYSAVGLTGTQRVPLQSLDQHLDRIGESRTLSVVKIDVQGAELLVLRGMQGALTRHAQVHILLEFAPDMVAACGSDPEELPHFLKALGFSAYLLSGHAEPCRLPWEDVLKCAKSNNYIDLLLSRQPISKMCTT